MANKIYQLDLDEASVDKLEKQLLGVSNALSSREFKDFLLKKCIEARDEIMLEKDIAHIEEANDSANQEKVDLYVSSNHTAIVGDTISLYNDAYLDKDDLSHFFSEEYKNANYGDGISLAELVEYGTGIRGAGSSIGDPDEWEYEVNPDRDYSEGWSYKGDNGIREHTIGKEGKYIYYTLANVIEKNIDSWVDEFIDLKIGSGY